MPRRRISLAAVAAGLFSIGLCDVATATEEKFTIDPTHTYPSFEADHFGLSIWRGKMNHTTGNVTLDRQAKQGDIHITIDLSSIDFGNAELNKWAVGPEFFNAAQYPQASYVGRFVQFKKGVPALVDGQLTLHGVTRPVELILHSFACKPHPMLKREWCGADVSAMFNRDDFGLTAGKDYGFKMAVNLQIQVEAVKDEEK